MFISTGLDVPVVFDTIYKNRVDYFFMKEKYGLLRKSIDTCLIKDHAAFEYFRKGNNMNTLSTILGLGGGFGVGWLVGGMLAGGEPNWIMGGVGAGLLIFSIPLSQRAQSNFNKSVALYNKNLSNESNYIQSSYLKLTFGIQEIGLRLTF